MPRVNNPMISTPTEEDYTFGDWTISVRKNHIMGSQCSDSSRCQQTKDICTFCR